MRTSHRNKKEVPGKRIRDCKGPEVSKGSMCSGARKAAKGTGVRAGPGVTWARPSCDGHGDALTWQHPVHRVVGRRRKGMWARARLLPGTG